MVLNERHEYLPIFRDARYARAWLPQTFYINQYASSRQHPIADFEEDIDPATLTLAGGRIATRNLSKWYETGNELKWDRLDSHSLVFAWDDRHSGEVARIDFVLPDDAGLDADARIVISLSAADVDTLPDDWEGDDTSEDKDDDTSDDEPLDWTILLTDSGGATASLPLSHDSPLYPQIRAVPRRAGFLDSEEPSEVLFRRFEFAVADFPSNDADFDRSSIVQLSFVLDRSPRGAAIVDDISMVGD